MEHFFFIGLLLLVFIGIPVGIGWFIYWAIKSCGHPKAARIVSSLFGLLVLLFSAFLYFEDELFSKNEAIDFIEEQGIVLQDEYEILINESSFAIGDYYHTFTLAITEGDKIQAISIIKNSDNFQTDENSVDKMLYLSNKRYIGPKVIQNYETKYAFVREYFEPSGQEGYAPTFRRVSISKSKNELTFEDIVE